MKYPELPAQWTAAIISMLSLREFSLLCTQYGFFAVWMRLDDAFYDYWQKTAPGTTFGEFLERAQVNMR